MYTHVHEKGDGGVAQDAQHGRRVGVEEGHAIGELVADDEVALCGVVVLRPSERGARQCTPVVAEVVLNRWRLHLELVELQHELENLGELFHQGLLGLQVLRGRQVARAELPEDFWDDAF